MTALEDLAPEDASAQVDLARAQLEAEREALQAAQDARRRGASAAIIAAEAELDQAVDGAWVHTRDTVRGETVYLRPGFATLASEPSEIDYGALVVRGHRAQHLHDRLFGHEGLAFLRRRYTEQVAAMASILRIIEDDDLGEDLDAIAGEGTHALLVDLQARYEAMVSARAARDRGADRIKLHVGRVRQAIMFYAVAIMGLIGAGEGEAVSIVEQALRPIVRFRELALRGRGAGRRPSEVPLEGEDADGEDSGDALDGDGAVGEDHADAASPEDTAAE